jgi:hypothetical protein
MMGYSIFAIATAAVVQAAGGHSTSAEQAQAQGYAQAQQALAGNVAQPVSQPAPTSNPAPQGQQVAATGQLNLTCLGGGTANKAAAATAWSNGNFSGHAGFTHFGGSTSGTTTVYGTRQQGFDDQVDIRLFGGDDRIRLPRTMLPPIHGGSDGWFKLKNVKADARSIHASAAVNFLNNPKVYIDRVTGTISISGKAGDFSGQCEAIDVSAAPKF